jgi:hypothetical protein
MNPSLPLSESSTNGQADLWKPALWPGLVMVQWASFFSLKSPALPPHSLASSPALEVDVSIQLMAMDQMLGQAPRGPWGMK